MDCNLALVYTPWLACVYAGCPHQVDYAGEMTTLSCPSGIYTLGNVCTCTLVPSNHCDPNVLSGLKLIVDPGRMNVSLSHALLVSTRRINICGDMHYGVSHSDERASWARELARPRTIIRMYTEINATDVGLPTPNDTKKAMPESVYGSTDSTMSVTTAKYEDAYSCPSCSRTLLPCRSIR